MTPKYQNYLFCIKISIHGVVFSNGPIQMETVKNVITALMIAVHSFVVLSDCAVERDVTLSSPGTPRALTLILRIGSILIGCLKDSSFPYSLSRKPIRGVIRGCDAFLHVIQHSS